MSGTQNSPAPTKYSLHVAVIIFSTVAVICPPTAFQQHLHLSWDPSSKGFKQLVSYLHTNHKQQTL